MSQSLPLQLHPINKMFPEILSLIFLQGHYSSHNYAFGWIHKNASPLICMQVCKHWRDVASHNCELWSTLSLGCLTMVDLDLKTSLAKQWLSRAKSHPLKLSLFDNTSFRERPHNTVLDVFMERAQFWQHIEFILPVSVWHQLESLDKKPAMPFLKSVTAGCSDIVTDEQQIRFFESAPSLTTVHIGISMHSASLNVVWKQIEKCSMTLGPQLTNVLMSMHSMVNLTLTINPDSAFPPHELITTIPSLRTLEFFCDGGRNPTALWDVLKLPALYDVRFARSLLPNDQSWGPQVLPYISRWSTTVKRISLRNAHLADDELYQIINYMPLIEKLEIAEDDRTDYVTNEFMERLTLVSREGQSGHSGLNAIAPNLQWIGFKGFYYQFDDSVFIKMVESRWNSPYVTTHDPGAGQVRRLKGVMLKPERSLDPRVTTRLEILKQEGLRVELFF